MSHNNPSTDLTGAVRLWFVKTLIGTLLYGVFLFVSAGDLRWGSGWAYIAAMVAVQIVTILVLLPTSPELLAERSRLQEGAKRWDVALAATVAYGPLLVLIVAGLDWRMGWQPAVASWLRVAALALVFLGGVTVTWAMASNKFFSGVVRIQKERGHTVASSGPYAWVRHPGYLGVLLYVLATPLALDSWWAYLPALLVVAVLFYRTAREDRTLQAELPGYAEYAQRVRYRLLPGIW